MTDSPDSPDSPETIDPPESDPATTDLGQFDAAARDALRRIIQARRDVRRRFIPAAIRPVPDDVLHRVLEAAHKAPSVGLTQPWDFLIVTDQARRQAVAKHVEEERQRFAQSLPPARARTFGDLKIEAIKESALNLVVTSTLERGGSHVLGRFTQPDMAHYSTCLAIENLWLTARAEGLGVGWVSFYRPSTLSDILGLPPHVVPIAYLCVGYVEEFDPAPELALRGWATPRPLEWAIHHETWEHRVTHPFHDARDAVIAPDPDAADAAREHHGRLTKPAGSLGALEDLGIRLAGMARTSPPPIPEPATVAVFAADHGVVASGVTPWPSEVTRQMVANFCGGGAAISAIARQVGAEVVVVDVGVAGNLDPAPNLLRRKVRHGTANIEFEPAMTADEALAALDVGAEVARELIATGARCLITGDMGIGNTTASAALIAWFTGRAVEDVVGRGTGINDEMLVHKTAVIDAALRRTAAVHDAAAVDADDLSPLDALASLGGLEIAALAGYIVGGAAARVPVLIDGVIAAASLVTASALCPGVEQYCIAGHRSAEPGSRAVLEHLGLPPLLQLDLRLGEGTGACLALPIVQTAARVLREMATFDQAGVTHKDDVDP
jgi:nicotinate-nucleotide--dimethylbenzimidazole phosphoribosyltransferase